jgi:hypothetical protein
MRRFHDFAEVWCGDFEFRQPPGERPDPLCLVAREVRSGRLVRLWRDDLRRHFRAPFDTGKCSLFVAFMATAEMGCFLSLGWPLPENVIDLYGEFKLLTSGLPVPCGHGLLGALAYFNVPGGVDELTKDEMRDLAQREGGYSPQEREALLHYCTTDVDGAARLLAAMAAAIEAPLTMAEADRPKALGQALLRGAYTKTVAAMEYRGVPIDTASLATLRASWGNVEHDLIEEVDAAYSVFEEGSFNLAAFGRYLERNRIPWPRTPTGRLQLSQDTFKEQAIAYPEVRQLHELRVTLGQMRDWALPVGADGRNRCMLSPFGARSGRNTPSTTGFIFGLAAWLRSLIRPVPGRAIAYLDYSQQEFGIAARLSGDRNMMDAYRSGDPYLAFAVQAGAAPSSATKQSHGALRDQFKTAILGTQYAMGAEALADRLGVPSSQGRELLRLHRETYPDYWRWSEGCVAYAMLHGHLTASFGWRIHVSAETRPTTLRNFLLQGNGAEMLRLACVLAHERGLPICAPVHDALLVLQDGSD